MDNKEGAWSPVFTLDMFYLHNDTTTSIYYVAS